MPIHVLETAATSPQLFQSFFLPITDIWTKCGIPHCHTFKLLSHRGRLGGGSLRQKLPLDGATGLLSKI